MTTLTVETIVETAQGRLRGSIKDGVHRFLGVAYGGATAQERRFMPPSPPQSWAGIRDAVALGPQAPQRKPTIRPVNAWIRSLIPTGEDCLVLNLYTPALNDGGARPVMVWMHGGAYSFGSGGSPGLDGGILAAHGDVVVVTLNHRLNAFGYCHLAGIGDARFADAGNAGMLDMVAALQWVRDNIAAFGGDANNVTIFGQSGGGSKVAALMTMAAAKGLFHKAIMQSSSSHLRLTTTMAAGKAVRRLMDELGMDDGDALQAVSADRLLAAYGVAVAASHGNDSFRPVVDGREIVNHPFDIDAPDLAADIPLLIGSCETERSFHDIVADPASLVMSAEGLRAQIGRFVGIDAQRANDLIAAYRERRGDAPERDLYNVISSDHMYRRNAIAAAEIKSRQGGAPAYLYEFTWKTPVLGGILKTPHTMCIPFVFGTLDAAAEFVGTGPEQSALCASVMETWVAFARTGNPNNSRLPFWAPYDETDRTTMIFDNECGPLNDPKCEDRLTINQCPQFISDQQWSAAA